jgi:hypothetical protein
MIDNLLSATASPFSERTAGPDLPTLRVISVLTAFRWLIELP